jgi:ethanolamine permease
MANGTTSEAQTERLQLLRVLGPAHIWALGVGIVLVGE